MSDVRIESVQGVSHGWNPIDAERGVQRLSDFDKGYNAAISDALQVLQDMPGIVDNDGSQPRPEPDYIERAEAVAEVEKLRR